MVIKKGEDEDPASTIHHLKSVKMKKNQPPLHSQWQNYSRNPYQWKKQNNSKPKLDHKLQNVKKTKSYSKSRYKRKQDH